MAAEGVDTLSALMSSTCVTGSEVSFAGQGLKLNSPDDAKVVIEAMNKCDDMKVLRLEGNTLGVNAAEAIAQALERHPEFERALWKDMFTGRLKTEIPPALEHLGKAIMGAGAHLVELDLSDNAFGPIGIDAVAALLESPSAYTLQELKFNNQGMGIGGGKRLAKCLINSHLRGTSTGTPLKLKVFIAGRNRLENPGSIALAEAFGRIGTLEEVQMPQNGIYHPGITALSKALALNPNMRHINLNDNTFTAVGAKAMAENALPHLKKLEKMNFGDCLLRTEGGQAIAQALSEAETDSLEEVILSFNEIKKDGAFEIVSAVTSLPHLKKLDLNGNQIGEEACEDIKEKFESRAKSWVLGSFSDDEGSEDEDEEEEEEEEDDDDEEVEDDETESELESSQVHNFSRSLQNDSRSTNDDSNLSIEEVEGKLILPGSVTAEDVFVCPTSEKILALEGDRDGDGTKAKNLILQHLGSSILDCRFAIRAVLKLSSAMKAKTDPHLYQIVCGCCDDILEAFFRNCNSDRDNSSSDESTILFTNELLVQLGLLKSEDKDLLLVTRDLWGPTYVLDHMIKQAYFPKRTKEVLQVFLSSTNKSLDSMKEMRHQVMTTLFSN